MDKSGYDKRFISTSYIILQASNLAPKMAALKPDLVSTDHNACILNRCCWTIFARVHAALLFHPLITLVLTSNSLRLEYLDR